MYQSGHSWHSNLNLLLLTIGINMSYFVIIESINHFIKRYEFLRVIYIYIYKKQDFKLQFFNVSQQFATLQLVHAPGIPTCILTKLLQPVWVTLY